MSSYEKNEKKQISVEQAQEQINKYEKIQFKKYLLI